jgi:hypothetical protein
MNLSAAKTLAAIGMAVLGINLCIAQSNVPPEAPQPPVGKKEWSEPQPTVPAGATNWGPNVQDVRLSIMMTNFVVTTGSTINVVAVITNASTNRISLVTAFSPRDFNLLLTNNNGKSWPLIPKLGDFLTVTDETIRPGEVIVRTLPAWFRDEIGPGDYTLKATRKFRVKDDWLTLESNVLPVRVK